MASYCGKAQTHAQKPCSARDFLPEGGAVQLSRISVTFAVSRLTNDSVELHFKTFYHNGLRVYVCKTFI